MVPTLAQKIETLAREPTVPLFATVRLANGFLEDISYRRFLGIVNKAALWLDATLPKSDSADDFPTFLYIGNLNIRLLALVVAAEITGRKVLLVRRHAPEEVRTQLAVKSKCSAYLYEDLELLTEKSKTCHARDGDVDHVLLPCWSSWFSCSEATAYSSNIDWKRTLDNPLCVFHTSGTTGPPKPVIWTNRRISQFASIDHMAEQIGWKDRGMVGSFPLHHVGGLMVSLAWPVYHGCIPNLQERDVPNTPEEVHRLLEESGSPLLTAQPSLLSSMLKSQHIASRMRQLDFIITGSSVLSSPEVDQIQENGGPTVFNLYGATETLPLRQNISDRDDWPYISFKPDSGVSFRHEVDDLYELVIHRSSSCADQPAVFRTFEDLEVFESQDLFTRHPQKPGLWRFSCRNDDMLKLADGRSVNVAPMEQVLMECDLVDAAIVGGQGRPATILLVVPFAQPENEDDEKQLRTDLWPYVEKANKISPPAATLQKNIILILPQRHQLSSRTDKGTINRLRLFEEFSAEIGRVFSAAAEV